MIVEYQGNTLFFPGDGAPPVGSPAGPLIYLVTTVDVANDWLFAVAVDPTSFPAIDTTIVHTYPGPGNYVARTDSCCRISAIDDGNVHINNPDGNYRVETVVNVGSGNSSPVATLPPIVACPQNSICSFFVPALDPNGDRLRWRLSTSAEAGGPSGFRQPGPPFAPSSAAIAQSGLYTWDTTGAALGPAGTRTYYSTQIMVEDLDSVGNVKSKVAVDFLIQLVPKIGVPPVLNSPPEITCGSSRALVVGETMQGAITASDPDPGQVVELNAVGMPLGATMTPPVPLFGNPAISTFVWTPSATAVGGNVIIFTARDSTGQQALCSITVNVVPRVVSGRMTGGGQIADASLIASHGFQLDCTADKNPSLQVNWGAGNRFHLEQASGLFCASDPAISATPPRAGFNILKGSGKGRLNGNSGASATWTFKDAGEPGAGDSADIVIRDGGGTVVLAISGKLSGGNHQAH